MPPYTFMRNCLRRAHAWPALFGLVLSGCSALGSVGADTFTLEGELPTDFALRAQAHYGGSDGCSGRGHVETFKKEYDKVPHGYQFEIPVSYRDGLCELQLVRVGLFIYGRYGEKDWQQTYDNGELVVVEELPPNVQPSQANGPLPKLAQCSWLFQISKLELEVSKMLDCKGAGTYLLRNTLPQKNIRLSFQLSGDDRPYMRNYWKKTATGWKPCTGRWGTRFEELCTTPPQFRTFMMEGRKCTVYPNCTE